MSPTNHTSAYSLRRIAASTFAFAPAIMLGSAHPTWAATVNALNCSQPAVQAAIASASNGDTVAVPAGNCTWDAGLTLSKGVHLKGTGSSLVDIAVNASLTITKHPSHHIELSGFTFRRAGGGNAFKILYVKGAWSAQPPLIHDNVFTVSNSGTIAYESNGGVIYNNTFNGQWDDSGIQHYVHGDTQSWSTADSMGTNDAHGVLNLYVEDNIFNGMSNQATDFGDASRIVFRHNTVNSSSFNSHGLSTGPIGLRHFEIYANDFNYPDDTVGQNWFIWLRGGTGVIYENTFDDIKGQMWGDKTEIGLSVRMADSGGVLGCATGYPAPHQIGQNHDGTQPFTDPVRLWGNGGEFALGIRRFPGECGLDIGDYLREGRDFVFAATPKPGYAAYPYPHPLRSLDPNPGLAAPSNLSVR